MKKLALLLIVLVVLGGCTAKPGVVSGGSDTYFVTRKAATNLANLDKLKAGAIQEASDFCLSQNKNIRVVNSSVSKPVVFGNLPKAAVEFMCIEKTNVE